MTTPFDHIKDENLKKLYSDIMDEPYVAFLGLQKLEKTASDKLAVFEAALKCIQLIVSDLDEHGADNETLYDDHDIEYFQELEEQYSAKIKELRDSGQSSTVFSTYEKENDASSDEIVAYLLGEESDSTSEQKNESSFPTPEERKFETDFVKHFAHTLEACDMHEVKIDLISFNAVRGASPDVVANLNGLVYNRVTAFLKAGDAAQAKVLAQRYRAYMNYIKGENYENFLSNAIVAAVVDKDKTFARDLLEDIRESLTNSSHPTLAYNIACAYAFLKNLPKLYTAVKKAIGLGKKAEAFLKDPDFAPFLSEPGFQDALKG